MNIIEGIAAEIRRVAELKVQYESLPGGAGVFGAARMCDALDRAQQTLASGDVIATMRSYEELKAFE